MFKNADEGNIRKIMGAEEQNEYFHFLFAFICLQWTEEVSRKSEHNINWKISKYNISKFVEYNLKQCLVDILFH